MTTRRFLLSVLALGSFLYSQEAEAQRRTTRTTKTKTEVAPENAAKWRAEHYVVDRDSAFADPRVGLRKLIGGNRRFMEDKSIKPRQNRSAILSSEKGQAPFAVIIGCADSRVPNEIIFDQGVGDLFIVRTAGQVMAQASYGSIEYATVVLNSKLIVVLGHESCGAVDAAVKRSDVPGHIVTLVNSIKPAAIKAKAQGGNVLDNAIRQNVIDQVNELRDLEPVLASKYRKGEILIVGGVYDLSMGKVEFLPETLKDLPEFRVSTK